MPFSNAPHPVGPVGFTHLSYAPSPPLRRTSRKHGRHRRRLRAFQPERHLRYFGYLGYLSTYLHVLRRLRVDLDVEAVLDRLDHRQKDRHVALRTHTVAARRVALCNAARVSASAQACVSWRSQSARACVRWEPARRTATAMRSRCRVARPCPSPTRGASRRSRAGSAAMDSD